MCRDKFEHLSAMQFYPHFLDAETGRRLGRRGGRRRRTQRRLQAKGQQQQGRASAQHAVSDESFWVKYLRRSHASQLMVKYQAEKGNYTILICLIGRNLNL